MTKIGQQRTAFLIVCLVIADVIYNFEPRNLSLQNGGVRQQTPLNASSTPVAQESAAQIAAEQEQVEAQQRAAAQRAAEEAAAEHARFLARYLNGNFSRTAGREAMAVVVATEDGKMDYPVATALVERFKSDRVEISASFFKPEFVSDSLFADIFGGSKDLLNKLELPNSLDALLLARLSTSYSQNPSLENVMTANMKLELRVVPIAGNIQDEAWAFIANGAGFSQGQAWKMAEERLIKQIAKDTNMSLGMNSQNR